MKVQVPAGIAGTQGAGAVARTVTVGALSHTPNLDPSRPTALTLCHRQFSETSTQKFESLKM